MLDHLLRHLHHPAVVLVGDIDLHAGKLRIVRSVHTLIAEVTTKLVNPLEATHDQPLEVKLISDAQVEWYVKRIVVRHERTSRSTTRDRLQDRRIYL